MAVTPAGSMKFTRFVLASLLSLAAAAHAAMPAAAVPPVEQVIVRFSPGAAPGASRAVEAQALAARSGVPLRWQREMSGGASVLRLEAPVPATAAAALASRLARLPGVDYAAPDYLRRPTLTPDDPDFSDQWALLAPTARSQRLPTPGGAHFTAAWDISTGSSTTVVAVLDTGVLPHPELAGRLLPGYDFISNTFVANDGDGRDSDAADPGNWVTSTDTANSTCTGQEPADSDWHGTAMAGVIAALSDNGAAIAGADWSARLLPVRVLGKCGGFDSDIIDALRWAAGLGVRGVPANPTPAHVINLSLGAATECGSAYRAAFNDLHAAGVVVVAAAGNDNARQIQAPANCPRVIAVTAHAVDGSNSSYANIGPGTALSAPGGGNGRNSDGSPSGNGLPILALSNKGSTSPTGEHTVAKRQGTSLATPLVAATASLLRSVLPAASPDRLRDLLVASVRPHPAGSWCAQEEQAGLCGSGLLDAGRALAAATALASGIDNLPPLVEAPTEVRGTAGTPLRFTLSASDPEGDPVTFTTLDLPAGATFDAGGRFDWSTPAAGEHLLRFTASDGYSTVGPFEVRLRIASASAAGAGGGGAVSPLWLTLLGLLLSARRRPD